MRESTELAAPGTETEARSESTDIAPAADRTGGVLYAYRAFMSYSHAADGLLVAALQDHLQRFAKPWYRRRAIRVFRDTTGLAVTPDLWHAIRTALAASEYFILFASEQAAQSQWIEQEVDFWLRQRAVEQMLIAWTDGKLQWDPAAADFDWARTTCLPPRLRGALRSEPLHLDLRWARTADDLSPRKPEFFDAVARFSAVLRGQPLDELIGEDVRQHRRTRRFATAAVGTLAGLLIVAVLAALTAIQQRNVARAERAIAEEQRTQSRERLLRLTVANGLRRIDERDFSGAGLWFAEALRMAPNTAVQATPERIRFAATLRAHPLLAQAWATTAKTPGRWINLSRDAHYATVGDGQEVRLYDVASGVEVPLQLPSNGHRVLAIDADDLHLIAADGEAGAVLWNVRSGAEVLRLDHAGGLSDADFSADGRLILTEGKDNTLRVWDRQTGRLAETFTLTGKLAFAGFGAASRNIFAVTDERIAHVWTLAPKAHIALAHKELVEVVKVAPDGRRALTTDAHEVRVWDTATGEQVGSLGNWLGIDYAEWSSDGQLAVTAIRSGHARVYDVARNEELAVVEHTGPVLHAAFSPDGKLIATASTDRTVKVSNARSGAAALATTLYHEDTVSHVSFSGDGSSLATITANGIARVWKLDTQPVTFRHPRGVRSVGFLPDGARLLIATDFEAQIWDSANDGAVLRLPVSSQVYQALLSPDGKQILTGVEAGVAQLWDVADGKEVFAISPRSKRSPSSATLLGSSNSHWTESDFSRSSSAEPCACGMSPIGARSRRFVKVRWMLPHSRRMASAWRWCRNVRP